VCVSRGGDNYFCFLINDLMKLFSVVNQADNGVGGCGLVEEGFEKKERKRKRFPFVSLFSCCIIITKNQNLQSLTRADRVDGDGELVEDNKDAKDDGDGDASKNQIPASVGSESDLLADLHGGGDSSNNNIAGAQILRFVIGETTAITTDASGLIIRERVGNSEETEESNDHGDEDEKGNSQKNNTENVHAGREEETVAERVGKAENKEDGDETREDQSNQHESLNELESGPQRRG